MLTPVTAPVRPAVPPRKRRGIRVSPELVASVQLVDGPAPVPLLSAVQEVEPISVGPKRVDLRVADLRLDDAVQQRAVGLSAVLVAEYAEDVSLWFWSAPLVVFHEAEDVSGSILRLERYWLADGFHRVAAAQQAGVLSVPCEVHEGGRRDAMLYACGANARHGARRTAADKRRAIKTLLDDVEWCQWSDRVIAEKVGCDHKTVAAVRDPLRGQVGNFPTSTQSVSGDTKRKEVDDSFTSTQAVSGDWLGSVPPKLRRGQDGKTYPVGVPQAPETSFDSLRVDYSAGELILVGRLERLAGEAGSAMSGGASVGEVSQLLQEFTRDAGRLMSLLRERVGRAALPGQMALQV